MKILLLLLSLMAVLAVTYGAGAATGGQGPAKVQAVEGGSKLCKVGTRYSSVDQQCFGNRGHSGDTENTKILRAGYPLSLECKYANKDVKLELDWFKDGAQIMDNDHYKIYQENSTLYVASASTEDVGIYRCQNKAPVTVSFNISVITLSFKNMPKSQTVLQGDKLALSCEAEGQPMPIITWLKDNSDVFDVVNASRYILEANDKGTENATFVIASAVYEDRAEYACVITSGSIQYNTTTYVRVKDMYAALWPFLGICAEVFILCVIIFIYEKRRAKADFEESDTDQPPEQKNTADNNKDSVRQRK